MPLNCQVGDLAIVISDEPGCEDNIGRIVKVLESASISGSSQAWWHIQPMDRRPWTCIQPIQGGKWFEVYQHSGRVRIEDHCLRPIRDGQRLALTQTQTETPTATTARPSLDAQAIPPQKSSATD